MKPLTIEQNTAIRSFYTNIHYAINMRFLDWLDSNTAEEEDWCPCGMPVSLCGGPKLEEE